MLFLLLVKPISSSFHNLLVKRQWHLLFPSACVDTGVITFDWFFESVVWFCKNLQSLSALTVWFSSSTVVLPLTLSDFVIKSLRIDGNFALGGDKVLKCFVATWLRCVV